MSDQQTTFGWGEPLTWPPAQCPRCHTGECGGHPVTDAMRERYLARPLTCDHCQWVGPVEDAMEKKLEDGLHLRCPRCGWTGEEFA